MSNYYFLLSRLPEVELGHPPIETFTSLLPTVLQQLSTRDKQQLFLFRLYYDLLNLKAYFRQEALSPYGNYDLSALEACLEHKEGLPEFVFEYLKKHDTSPLRLAYFAQLLKGFFHYVSQNAKGFVKDYYAFERECRIILTAFRCKCLGKDPLKELQFEEGHDPLVAWVFAQKDAKHFDPPEAFSSLKENIERFKQSPMGLLKAYEAFRLDFTQDLAHYERFSFDRVLAHLLKLMVVEQWHQLELQEKIGNKHIQTILEAI